MKRVVAIPALAFSWSVAAASLLPKDGALSVRQSVALVVSFMAVSVVNLCLACWPSKAAESEEA